MDLREVAQEIQFLQIRAQELNERLRDLSAPEIAGLPALQPTLETLWGTLQAKSASQASIQVHVGRLFTENRRQRALLDAIFEADPGGLAVLTGPELRFVFANPAYRFITPDPLLDPVGKPYDQVWPTKSQYGNRDRFREVLRTGQPFQLTGIEHAFTDGTRRIFTLQARRLEWEDELAVMLFLWDVTELKKAEEELRSAALFPEQNPDPILRIGLDGRLLYANPAGRSLLPDLREGQPVPPFWRELVQQARQTGENRAVDYQHADRIYVFSVVPIPAAGYVNLYGRDVTERKKASQALQQANARLRSVLGSITEVYAVFDREWRIVDLNRTAEQHFFPDQPPGAMVGRDLWEVLPQEVDGEFYHAVHHAMETGQPVHTEAGSRINGKWFEVHAHPRDDQLELYMRDVSERHRAEEALREREARLKRSQEMAHLGSWELDLTTNRLTWSDEVYRIFGLQPQAFGATYEAFLDAVHAEDRAAVDAAYTGSIREGRDTYEIDHRVVRKSTGEIRFVHEKCEHIRDASGQIVRSIGMVQDITERTQAEEQKIFQGELLENVHDAVIATDLDLTITAWNKAAQQLYGWAAEETLGKPASQLLRSEITDQERESVIRQLEQAGVYVGETVHQTRDGRRIIVENHTAFHRGPDGQPAGFISSNRDITERKRIEQALRFSEERFTKAFDASPVGLVISRTEDGLIELVNTCFEQIFGYRREEVIGKTSLELSLYAHPENRQEIVRRLRERGAVEDFELEIRTKSGELRQAMISIVTLAVYQEPYMLTLFQDITERKQAERQARDDAARITAQQRLIEQREQERLQIARDLHDGPVQELTGITFALRGVLLDHCTPEIAPQLETIQAHLQEQINELRAYAGQLRPPALSKFGLGKAILSHLEAFEEKHPGVLVQFEDHQEGELLAQEKRLALFRIFQEALTNISKHAQATRVTLRLEKSEGEAILEIQDNGVGFVVTQDWLELIGQGHLGLAGMRERAEAAGGRLEIQSVLGEGTTVRVEFPLQTAGPG